MDFQSIIQNTWTKEELNLLLTYSNKTNKELFEIFKSKGFGRSVDAIRRKRNKLLKDKFDTVAKENSKELLKLTEELDIVEIRTKPISNINKKLETTLCIADCHVFPGQSLDRFIALGKLANNKRPDNIIFLGDMGDFDSLSSFDRGKEASHGKRYKDEIKACKNALVLFLKELDKDYSPNLVFCGGNHDEGRIENYINNHPLLRDHMDLKDDLCLEELGFIYVPYRKFYEINGTMFTHAIMNGANSPISSKNITSAIASLMAKSVVVGHHHRLETASFGRHGSNDVLQVLLVGMFSEDTPLYADGGLTSYNRGVCIITHTGYGQFDIENISLNRMKAEYLLKEKYSNE